MTETKMSDLHFTGQCCNCTVVVRMKICTGREIRSRNFMKISKNKHDFIFSLHISLTQIEEYL